MKPPRHRLALPLALLACACAAAWVAAGPCLAAPAAAPDTSFRHAAAWDSLTYLEDRVRWVECEALANSILARLARSPALDSMDYSRALIAAGGARIRRNLFADGLGVQSIERGIAIRSRHAPRADLVLVRAHVRAAINYTDAGKVNEAVAHGQEALRLLEAFSPRDSNQAALAEMALAVAQARLGRNAEARGAFDRALALRVGSLGHDHPMLVPTLAQYGDFLARAGEFEAGRELLQWAARNSARDTARNSDLMEGTLARLSTLERRLGNLAESVELAQHAYELARRRRGDAEVSTMRRRIQVAYRLSEMGDHAGAIRELEAVLPMMDSKVGPGNAQTINARLELVGDLILEADTARAVRQLAIVAPELARQEDIANVNQSNFRALEADLEIHRGHLAAARETLALAIRSEAPKREAAGTTVAGLLARALGTTRDESDRAYVAGLSAEMERLRDSTNVRATPQWVNLLATRARAEARTGQRDPAWSDALVAEDLARRRLTYSLEALPDRRALQFAQTLSGSCDLLTHLARADHPEELTTAWDRVVRWRGLVGHEIARRRLPARAGGDTALAAAHGRWLAAQRRLAQLVVSGAAHPDDPAGAERFENARRDAEEAERRYVRRARGAVAAEDSVTLARTLERLGPDQALIAFARSGAGEDRTGASLGAFVAVGPARPPRYVPLGREGALGAEIHAWVSSMAVPPESPQAARRLEQASRRLGQRVRAAVWDPIARELHGASVAFVVPEGPIAELPWLALPGAGSRYLADEPLTIRVLNAERELLPAAEQAPATGLLAVGGPDFEAAGRTPQAGPVVAALMRVRAWPCAGEPVALPPLPAARAEADDIARLWPDGAGPAEVLAGQNADEATFKREAPGHRVIHVATHGVVVEDTCGAAAAKGTRGLGGVEAVAASHPARRARRAAAAPTSAAPAKRPSPWLGRQVWLALAGANRPPSEAHDENEGLLTAEEITTLDLRGADWVVLSACQSGVAPVWAQEGVLGMRRAFALAGAHAVIASQWPVADEATREWMTALYAARAAGLPAGAAVQQACRTVLAARRRAHHPTAPFYWAAFTATGD